MRRHRHAVTLAFLLGLGFGRAASAQTITVTRPDRSDQTLVEAFSRLCGELRMYGLQVRLVDGEDTVDMEDSAQAGKPTDAIGGVSLVRTDGEASARIWVAADAPGKKSVRITVSVADADAPSLLAIRAADLLRASLRDLRGTDLGEREAESKTEAAAKPAEKEVAEAAPAAEAEQPQPPRRFRRWSVFAGPAALVELGGLGTGWGATVQARARMGHRLGLMLAFTAPVRGQTYEAGPATAHVRQELATLALAVRLVASNALDLEVFQGLGAMHLSVHGEAQAPWLARDASTWAATSATGTAARLALTEHVSLQVSAALLFLVPRPIVDVAEVSYMAHQPFVLFDAGIAIAF